MSMSVNVGAGGVEAGGSSVSFVRIGRPWRSWKGEVPVVACGVAR